MLLAVSLWVIALGYTVAVWGVRLATGQPQGFAYLLGISPTP